MKTLDSVNIPIRKDETHKGDYGKILLIGGSANMGGAIMLLHALAFIVEVGLLQQHTQIIMLRYILVVLRRWL